MISFNLCRLIYRSTSSSDFISNEELENLANTATKNNSKTGITGMLIHSGDEFLQVLEGPEVEVNRLFQTISRDKRHREVRLVTFEFIASPYFDDWSMRVVDLYDIPGFARTLLMQKYAHVDEAILIPENLTEIVAFLLDIRAIVNGQVCPA